MAFTDRHEIYNVDSHCCEPWSKAKSRWRTVDAWGQVVGSAEIVSRSYYEYAECYDTTWKLIQGSWGAGLLASEDGDWRPPPSVQWTPSPSQMAALSRMVDDVYHAFVFTDLSFIRLTTGPGQTEGTDKLLPLERRTLLFTIPPRKRDSEPAPPNPTQFAVVGGPVLLVAFLHPDERWIVSAERNELTDGDRTHLTYQPIAVFDVDEDGFPEIIYRFSEGEWWGETILKLDTAFDRWREVATSVMGSIA
ncbi:MAG: hypothetical protein PHU25_01315 [Deltaproteobacteria bacterium]|nr:hypothetical protein [Deltaproteobacteria bacterium]